MTYKNILMAGTLIILAVFLGAIWIVGCSGGGGGGGSDPAPNPTTTVSPSPSPTIIPTNQPLPDPPVGSGTVGFTSQESGLNVYVDDKYIGKTLVGYYLVEYLSAGIYDIYYTDSGGKAIVFQTQINVISGDKIPISNGSIPSPSPTPSISPTVSPTPSPTPTEARAQNNSYQTLCAEEDNVNVFFYGETTGYTIEATHPSYIDDTPGNCEPDFTNCTPVPEPDYPFTPGIYTLYDDHDSMKIEAVREERWWRPNGMTASVKNSTEKLEDIHYIRIYHRIAETNSWPQFLVLYMDGNLRIKPQPPIELTDTCFGSSVIVGPNVEENRPIAEISEVICDPANDRISIVYKDGNKATLSIGSVNRIKTIVNVENNFTTNKSFLTFRSMYVASGNADVDSVQWKDASGSTGDSAIMDFIGGDAFEWFFYRKTRSKHNTYAPDIKIKL